MNRLILKIAISVICTIGVIGIAFFGDKLIPVDNSIKNSADTRETYIDAFKFDPEKISYDGVGDLDFLEGVSLEGYSEDDLKDIVFIKVYTGNSLSEKIIQYTADTEEGKVRSTRPLDLYQYNLPAIYLPDELPEVTRDLVDNLGDLLMAKSGYAVDDGFGKDAREHAEISYEQDATKSDMLHYKITFENKFGDETIQKLDVRLKDVPAYLELEQSEITIKKGETFDPTKYLIRAEFADGGDASSAVQLSGYVDTDKVGPYEIEYELKGEKVTLHVYVAE